MSGTHRKLDLTRAKGYVYFDQSSKGHGKRHNLWCAEIQIAGVRLRKRSSDQADLERWLGEVRAVLSQDFSDIPAAQNYEVVAEAVRNMKPKLMQL